jgi:primosomal protein N' (replication factor Y) (superfamily II helicase)
MPYAEVSVNSPIAQKRTFSYGIPDGLSVVVGQAVWAPFGEKTLQGIVMELTEFPAVEDTREIAGIIDPVPLLSTAHISLARWISHYYLSPLFEAAALMLPPGFERRVIAYLEASPGFSESSSNLHQDSKELVEYVTRKGPVRQKEVEKSLGARCVRYWLPRLIKQHLLTRKYELERPKVKPKTVLFLKLKVTPAEVQAVLNNMDKKSAKKSSALQFLLENPGPQAASVLKTQTGGSPQTIRALISAGLVEIQEVRVDRDPLGTRNINLSFPLSLTAGQEAAFLPISLSLKKESSIDSPPDIFLLRGITGSGKTEIYLRTLAEAIKQGKKGLVLVPEISMTPQIIERFVSRFPGRVAILHSELSLGEQFDEWWRIKNGDFDVVIGPRSAIFAPQPDLGLIIIDEEHEWTYKQQENTPHYHTREVAVKLAELTGATVVLGSATPDVESYYKALNGNYHLLELTSRVTPDEGSPLPEVDIIDLRDELRAGNLSLFSRLLHDSIQTALENREQILLFLNRRGSASFIECRNCGWVVKCKRCEVPMSYHFTEDRLVCHQCGNHIKPPTVCPSCGSRRIKYLGAGTEKLEQEAAQTFPQARILRWDSDVTGGHGHSHEEIFARFRAGEADILIGTQMIAKGLDLPGVTLVGVVSADIALNLPDFRAGERTFQLLSQVAGRAGRGQRGGRVIIQTYSPQNYAIKAAAKHDYMAFYRKEMAYRYQLHNPPFIRLARLVFTHSSDDRGCKEAERIRIMLLKEREAKGISGVSLIGPAPAYLHRLRGKYRWQIILRAPDPSSFLSGIAFPRGWSLDIDPVGLL